MLMNVRSELPELSVYIINKKIIFVAANLPGERPYTTNQSAWSLIVTNSVYLIMVVLLLVISLCLCKSMLCRCCSAVFCVPYRSDSSDGMVTFGLFSKLEIDRSRLQNQATFEDAFAF